jgi:hypothetical protein
MVKADYWAVTDGQVIEKTGHPIAHWTALLETFGARDKPSAASVDLLQKTHGVPRYWARTLVTGFLKRDG